MALPALTKPKQVTAARAWAIALIEKVGGKPTTTSVAAVMAWEQAESGSNPTFRNNPLNVTLLWPGGRTPGTPGRLYSTASPLPGNSAGVAVFKSRTVGLTATAWRITHTSIYTGIHEQLATGTTTPALSRAVSSSPWGTPTFAGGSTQATLLEATPTGRTLKTYEGKLPPTGRRGLGPGGTVGNTQILVSPSIIPGVSATAPSNPSLDPLNPIGSLATSLTWFGEFGAWGFLTLTILLMGVALLAIGMILLLLVLLGPAVSTAGNALLNRSPVGAVRRAVAPASRARRIAARTALDTARARRRTRNAATRSLAQAGGAEGARRTGQANRTYARRVRERPFTTADRTRSARTPGQRRSRDRRPGERTDVREA